MLGEYLFAECSRHIETRWFAVYFGDKKALRELQKELLAKANRYNRKLFNN
jgi:hypothetical protein